MAGAQAAGLRGAFVTNNASRSSEAVAALLTSLGIRAEVGQVTTSAQAAADLLAGRLAPGAAVLVVGTDALAAEIRLRDLLPVRSAAGAGRGPVSAVVQGHDPATAWPLLAEAAVAIGQGAWWVACNTDSTLPSPRGLVPGNGAMVAALCTATGATPTVAGKPEPVLFQAAIARHGAERPLAVGDRLDTDVAAAAAADVDALLVLTGVCDLEQACAAPRGRRPRYLSATLEGLAEAHPEVEVEERAARCADAEATLREGVLRVRGGGTAALRAQCALAWSLTDSGVPWRLG